MRLTSIKKPSKKKKKNTIGIQIKKYAKQKKIVKPENVGVQFPVSAGLEIALKRSRCTDDDVNCYTNELPARHS